MEADITDKKCPYCQATIVQTENGETFCITKNCTYNTKKAKLKYNNVQVQDDGYKFDSKAERNRYHQLKYMQGAGEISELKVHPVYELQASFERDGKQIRAINYEGDFSYIKNGEQIVEDVKGVRTKEFNTKYKLFLYKYPEIKFIIREIVSGKKRTKSF
jgi:uncharacterized Zn finger protein (UPF0148 family)